MAVKKIYYFKVSLFDENNSECKFSNMKSILNQIINSYSHKQENYRTLDLTEDVYEHVLFDIYDYEENRLFGRFSKQKPSNSLVKRNYKNWKKEDFQSNDREIGIEQYTYGYLDYNLGVFAMLSSLGAPTEKAFEKVFQKYASNFRIEMVPVPNPDSIDKLYNADASEVSSIEIEVPLPNMEFLQNVFGWKSDDMLSVLNERNLVAKVQVKTAFRKSYITHNSKESKNLIDKIRENSKVYNQAKLKAKTSSTKMREYDFFEQYFSYSIDVSNYRIENYERVYYSVDELMQIFKQNMVQSFIENKKVLKEIIGR